MCCGRTRNAERSTSDQFDRARFSCKTPRRDNADRTLLIASRSPEIRRVLSRTNEEEEGDDDVSKEAEIDRSAMH